MANDIEISVRVSNQTAGGLTGVNTALNRLKTKAQDATQAITGLRASLATAAELEIKLDDQTAAGIAAIQANVAALRAESPLEIRAEFTGDSAEILASAAALESMQSNGDQANHALATLTARAAAAALALEALTAAARDASNALRTLRGRAAAAAAAMQELRASSAVAGNGLRTLSTRVNNTDGRMEALAARTHALTMNMDALDGSARRAGGSLGGLRGRLGSVGSAAGDAAAGSSKLMMAALALAPALVPIVAAATPMVPALLSAGAAMAAFGAAVMPQIGNLKSLARSEALYTAAVENHGASSKTAVAMERLWLQAVANSPIEILKASAALQIMKDRYQAWSDSLADDTLPVATKAFGVFGALFPKLTPLVKASSVELDRLMNMLAVGVQSHGFDEFMVKMADFSQRTLRSAIDGMVSFGQAMNRGIQGDSFREFLTYVRESGPVVAETLGELMRALMKIVYAAADTGVGILTLVNAFARLVNAVPTELLSVLLQTVFAFKALQLVSLTLGPALMSAAGGLSFFIRSARVGGVSNAVEGLAQRLTGLQKATIALAVLTAVAVGINELAEKAKGAPPDVDRLTTSLKNLGNAGKFTGELKKTFGDMDGFIAKVNNMRNSAETFDRAKPFTSLLPMGAYIDKAAEKIDNLGRRSNSFTALQDQLKAFDESFSSLARSGHADEAATQFERFEEALRSSGKTTEEIAALFPEYNAAVASLAADQEMAARSMGLFGEQAGAVQAKLDLQKQSADGLRASIMALNDVNRSALDGMIGFEAAIDAAAKGAAKNAGSLNMVNGVLDLNSEKARTAAGLLSDLAGKTSEAALAARENGASWETVSGIMERGRAELIESARTMGLTKGEAKALADQILSTPDKTAYLRGDIEDLQAKLKDAQARLAAAPSYKQVDIRAEIADLLAKMRQAQAAVNSVDDRTIFINTVYRTFREQHPGGQAQAHGGIIGAAGGGPRSRMTLVGEQGPELVDLAPGSRVRSNPDSKRIAAGMAGGGSGGPTVLEIRSSGSRIDDMLLEILRGAISAKGGDVQLVLGGRRTP